MAKKRKNSREKSSFLGTLNLSGISPEEQYPEMAIYALDRSGTPIETLSVGIDGQFELSEQAMEKAHRIAIGPMVEALSKDERKVMVQYRPEQVKMMIEASEILEIPKKSWCCWYKIKLCVSGTVKYCNKPYYYPGKYTLEKSANLTAARLAKTETLTSVREYAVAKPLESIMAYSWCQKICDGVVEVYRRHCCCWPWEILDPRIPELIKELEELIPEPWPPRRWPPKKWPPIPGPDPGPLRKEPVINSGALNMKAANAEKDLYAIKNLPQAEVAEYIRARSYLHCNCSSPIKVAEGFIRPDGEFHICWWEQVRLMLLNCHDEYAFVIKQNIEGNTVTIYDGVASGQWYKYGDHAEIKSYHPDAVSCRENDFPGDGAFALLQDIGYTGSWRLKTPTAKEWDRVNVPGYNDGLSFPATNAAAAIGKYLDRNWGGLLKLRYHFSEEMKGIGAKYYRVSVISANSNGNPVGARTYINPGQWKYYEKIGSIIYVRKVSLGPVSKGGESHLYEIPYDDDHAWQSGQFHALLDTTKFTNGRFLLTLEVFDNTGKMIRPNGTTNPGSSLQKAFTYHRWYQETGPTQEVPYAALTHMFWWDNRKAEALIEDFRVNGVENNQECQFLVDAGTANFSVGYRAYHPEPMFMLDHRLWWKRGLGGSSGYLTAPDPNPNNVGIPPSLPHQSGSSTFSDMLGTLSNGTQRPKCSFTISLHTNVKTFNGSGILDALDDWDQASMALEIP